MKRLPEKYRVIGVVAVIYGVTTIVFWPGLLISLGLIASGIALVMQRASWLRNAPAIMFPSAIGSAVYSVLTVLGIMELMGQRHFMALVVLILATAFLVAGTVFAVLLGCSAFTLSRHLARRDP